MSDRRRASPRSKSASAVFPIDEAIRRIRRAIKSMRQTTLNQIAEESITTPYRILVSCIISLRTKDDVTNAASRRLFTRADSPQAMIALAEKDIAALIYPAGFYNQKARQIRDLSRQIIDQCGGKVPDTIEGLVEFRGVGRKTANLVITLGYGKPGICVDTHVHRITNRWGYVKTKSPDQTEMALRAVLPRRHWIPINDLLVTWGQNVCVPLSPHCSACPLAEFCPRLGVKRSR